jgi:predicted DNA-binding transcriptional regulator AlpA
LPRYDETARSSGNAIGRFIGEAECLNKTNLSRSTRDVLMKEGLFPKRYPLAKRRKAWLAAEIDDWIAERVAARGIS